MKKPIHSSRIARIISAITLAFMAAVLSGCIMIGDPDVKRLQDPVWVCPRPVLDGSRQAKQDDADEAIYLRYEALSWKVVESKQTPLCAIIDCIDKNSFSADSWAEPPPPPTPEEMFLPAGVGLALTEIDVHTDLRCPYGSTAVDRPSYSAYVFNDTGATSLQDWLDNYPEVLGAPDDPVVDRLYAGVETTVDNGGANTWINAFNGGELEPGTMSLLEMAVGCPNPNVPKGLPKDSLQQVGIAASRNALNTDARGNTGDTALRLQVEFYTAGANVRGPRLGGWDRGRKSDDFIRQFDSPYGPGATFDPSTTSTVGGSQFESFFQIKLKDGKWWVGHNGNWLGFYKAELFYKPDADLLASHACQAFDYGEMGDGRKDKTTPVSTDMGSGQFADTGFGSASYFRDPVWVDLDGITWYWPDMGPVGGTPGVMTYSDQWGQSQYNPACYTFAPLTPASPHRVMYCGGRGCR